MNVENFWHIGSSTNDQEESVSSAVYKYDTSTNAAFFENFPDYPEGYQCWYVYYKKVFLLNNSNL